MKFLKKLFKKEEPAIMPNFNRTLGVTVDEWCRAKEVLSVEYDLAKSRQKESTIKPSGYMKGLQFAMSVLEGVDIRHIIIE